MSKSTTIRPARPGDEPALRRLTELEGRRLPQGRLLVAEVDGDLWAAVSADTGEAVADPFRRTEALVAAARSLRAQFSDGSSGMRAIRPYWPPLRARTSCQSA